jgi:hypothetical protein
MKLLLLFIASLSINMACLAQSNLPSTKADSLAKLTPRQMDSARSVAMRNLANSGGKTTQTETVSAADELLFIRKNLGAYQRAHDSGMVLQIVGLAVGVGGYLVTNKTSPNVSKIMPFIGGGLWVLGWGVYVSAGRFMHRIELGVNGGGANVRYTF